MTSRFYSLSIGYLLPFMLCFFNQTVSEPSSFPDTQETSIVNDSIHYCAQELIHEKLWSSQPIKQEKHLQYEASLLEYLKKNEHQETGEKADYTIPVVVHIIHDNGAENISDATILQGMQHLNDAYENVGYYDQGTGVNTNFAFCLARRDPDGNATTGINRVVSPLTEMVLEDDDITVKDLSRWDPTQYLNIWLVREICSNAAGCGVAGYAYFPASHGGAEDGIMMEANWFGSDPGSSSVIVHEAGHYLGLYHTFQDGCPNNDCLVDGDRVCDTPPDASTAAVPCNGSINSCTTDTDSGFTTDQDDQFWNYMDYGDWNCYSAFSQGQTDRMVFTIENDRKSLLDSKGCIDPCNSPLTAAFSASLNTVDVGETINFINNSTNANSADWTIDNVNFANTTDASYTFLQVGFFEICLEIGNTDPNCSDKFCQTIEITCPVAPLFETSNFYPFPGQSVNYTNLSSNAIQYEWQIDGVTQSTDADFTWSFQDEGIYDVCLIASNGLCEREFCLPVFVSIPVDVCEGPFLSQIGENGSAEFARAIASTSNDELLIGGQKDDASLLLLLDEGGNLLWERSFDITAGPDFITNLWVDAEGMLVMIGRDASNAAATNFVVRYDYQNDVVLWSKQFTNPAYSRFVHVTQLPSNDNYLISGMVENPATSLDNLLMEIDKNTGNQVWIKTFHAAGNTDIIQRVLPNGTNLLACGVNRYGGGLDKIRATISNFALDGTQNWTRSYLSAVASSSRHYMSDIIIDNNNIVAAGHGVNNGSNTADYKIHLIKTELDGTSVLTKEYDIVGNATNQTLQRIIALPNGYLLQGNYSDGGTNAGFFIVTDKQGELLWAKSISGPATERLSDLALLNGFIYFTGHSASMDPAFDIFLGRIDENGDLGSNACPYLNDLAVEVVTIVNPFDEQNDLTEVSVNYGLLDNNIQSNELDLFNTFLPNCECLNDSECDTTFLKTYGSNLEDEFGYALTGATDGGFFLGGGKGIEAMISKLDGEGNLIWTRKFDPTGDASDFIWEIKLDTDNDLIGIGQTRELGGNVEAFAFKYDWQNDNFAWINEIDIFDPALEGYFTIIENPSNGNYNIFGQSGSLTSTNAFAMEVNRNTGAILWSKEYGSGGFELFQQTVLYNNNFYSTGHYQVNGNELRPGITRLDLAGNEIWSKLHLVPSNAATPARLIGKDIVADNGFVVFGNGNSTGGAANTDLFLYRTNESGVVEWDKSFEIPSANFVEATSLLNLPDGYLCLGYYTLSTGGSDIFLFKTNKQGTLEWSKSYDGIYIDEVDEAYDMIWQNGQIFFTGKTTNGIDEDVFLARLGVDGEPSSQDSCNLFSDLTIVEDTWTTAIDEDINILEVTSNDGFFSDFATTEAFILEEDILCFSVCNDSCDFRPDAVFESATAICQGDSMLVTLTICNNGNFELPSQTSLVFYDLDPTTSLANLWHTDFTDQKIKRDSCRSFELSMPSFPNQEIYVMINDAGTTPLPFNLSDEGDFPNTSIIECDFTNNIGSFEINYTPLILDLGPDIVACENGVTVLDAGPGFYEYRWQDGEDEQTYTAFFPGTYTVEVTDSCGNVQSDQVTITVDPASIIDLGNDTLVCEGDGLNITLTGFDRYEWFPKNVVPCDTCASIDLFPGPEDTLEVIVVASTDLGCYSLDTIEIGTTLPVFTYDTLFFCPGDTINIFGEEVTETGIYMGIFEQQAGCDSTHTISLEAIANLLLVLPDDLTIELGDSVLLNAISNGQNLIWEWSPSTGLSCDNCPLPFARPLETTLYTLVITDENGCDVSDDVLLSIIKNRGIYIPNAFSPNGDGVNDLLQVYTGPNVARILDFKVFDRWGEMVFSDQNFPSNDPSHGWNGQFKDKIMNPAVFAYKVEVEFIDGFIDTYYGDVTLIR